LVREQSEKVENIFFLLLIFSFCFLLASIKVKDPDAFIHIKLGEYIYKNFAIPDHDPFVYTYYEARYNDNAWLSQLIYYIIYRTNGLNALIIFNAIIVGVTYSILFQLMSLQGYPKTIIAIVLLAISYVSKERFVLRPHIFSLLLLSVTVYLTNLDFLKKRYLTYFLVFLLWSNLHSGFIYGLVVLGGCFLEGVYKKLTGMAEGERYAGSIINFLCAICGTFINPVPLAGYRFSAGLVGLKTHGDVLEWRSLLESHYNALIGIVILSILFAVLNWRRLEIRHWITILVFVPAGFWAWRQAYELLIVIFPFTLAGIVLAVNRGPFIRILNHMFVIEALPVVLTFILLFNFKMNDFFSLTGFGTDPRYYPSGAIKFLKNSMVEGNIFNSFNYGGALLFELYPEKKIFIDGLSSGIAQEFLARYFQSLESSEKFNEIADKYHINVVIIESDRGYIKRGILSPRIWKLVYWDDYAMVLFRNEVIRDRTQIIETGDPSDVVTEAFSIPPEQSETFLNELYKIKKLTSSFLVDLSIGIVLRTQGKLEEAIDMLEKAYLEQPFSYLAMVILAKTYKDAGYFRAAEWLFKRAILLNGGLTGLSTQPFYVPSGEIKKIRDELKEMEVID